MKDLVKAGDVRREQASTIVRDLMETSKASRQELIRFVRSEIQTQVGGLGLASQREVERLERRVARLEAERRSAAPASSEGRSATKKSTAKKSPSKKSTRKRSTARKATGAGTGSGKSTS